MKQEEIKILTATVRRTAEEITEAIAVQAGYSHLQLNGVVYACVVAITEENGVWFYLERKLYTSLRHEVYARLNEVDYQDYLEFDDFAEARYPEPTEEDLKDFFVKFRQDFMPLRGIVDHTVPAPQPLANASNAELLGDIVVISSPAKA